MITEGSVTVPKRLYPLLLVLLMVFSAGALAEEDPAGNPEEETIEYMTEEPADAVPEEPETEPAEEPEELPAERPAEEPAEEPEEPAAPCAHENTVTVYYFDSPDYRALDNGTHSVAGRATAEELCTECGEVLSIRTEESAREIRPHVFHNGMCALCGWEDRSGADDGTAPGEVVVILSAAEDNPDQFFCTLTQADLSKAGDTLVLRPAGSDAAIVLQAKSLREQISSGGGGTLTAEIEKPGSRYVSAFVRMYNADGSETRPGSRGVSLRIYGEYTGTPLTVSFTGTGGASGTEEARWTEEGYWTVTWQGDGVYTFN